MNTRYFLQYLEAIKKPCWSWDRSESRHWFRGLGANHLLCIHHSHFLSSSNFAFFRVRLRRDNFNRQSFILENLVLNFVKGWVSGWCIARLCFYLLTIYFKKQRRVSEKITLWILRIAQILRDTKTKRISWPKKWLPARFWARNALTGHSSIKYVLIFKYYYFNVIVTIFSSSNQFSLFIFLSATERHIKTCVGHPTKSGRLTFLENAGSNLFSSTSLLPRC